MPIVAVGGIGVVIAALLALLVIYGSAVLARTIGQLIPNWHIPGLGNIRDAVISGAETIVSTLASWLSAAVTPIASWIRAPWHVMAQLYGKIVSLSTDIYHAIVSVKNYASRIYQGLLHLITERIAAVVALANTLYRLAIAAIGVVATELTHLIAERVTALTHLISFALTRAEAYALALYHLSVSEAHTLYQHAIHYADVVARVSAAGAVGALVTDVTHAISIPWIEITDEIKALEGVIASDLPDIGALARAIPKAIPIDIAALGVGTLAIDRLLIRYLAKCGIPNCKNLGGFGNLLKDLINVAEGAALLGLLAEAVRDPEGTAAELDSVIGGTVRGAAHVLTSAVGG